MSTGLSSFIQRIISDLEVTKEVLFDKQNKSAPHVRIKSNNSPNLETGMFRFTEDTETGSLFKYTTANITPQFGILKVFLTNRKLGDSKERYDEYHILNSGRKLMVGDIYAEYIIRFEEVEEKVGEITKKAIKAKIASSHYAVCKQIYRLGGYVGEQRVDSDYVVELGDFTDYRQDPEAAVNIKIDIQKTARMVLENVDLDHYRTEMMNNALILGSQADLLQTEVLNSDIYQGVDFIGPEYIEDFGDKEIVLEVTKDPDTGYIKVDLNEVENQTTDIENIESNPPYVKPDVKPSENKRNKAMLSKLLQYENLTVVVKDKVPDEHVCPTPPAHECPTVPPVTENPNPPADKPNNGNKPLTPLNPSQRPPVIETPEPPVDNQDTTPPVDKVPVTPINPSQKPPQTPSIPDVTPPEDKNPTPDGPSQTPDQNPPVDTPDTSTPDVTPPAETPDTSVPDATPPVDTPDPVVPDAGDSSTANKDQPDESTPDSTPPTNIEDQVENKVENEILGTQEDQSKPEISDTPDNENP